jgi:nitrite reductase/ring-hydroxylating ferredoxin subunit
MTAGTLRATDPADSTEITGPVDPGPEAELVTRRRVFAVCSVGALALGLAACGGGSSEPGDVTTLPTTAGDATTGGSEAAPAESLTLLSQVPVGGAISVTSGDKKLIVAQPNEGEAVAFSAVCPHQGGIVAVKGDRLECPLHKSTFEETTGKYIKGPANGKSLAPVAVEVTDGQVTLKA